MHDNLEKLTAPQSSWKSAKADKVKPCTAMYIQTHASLKQQRQYNWLVDLVHFEHVNTVYSDNFATPKTSQIYGCALHQEICTVYE